jgi:succinoglycan biosynthesis protein ExoL
MHDRVRPNRKRLVFFAPDIVDISTRNRAEAFCEQGFRLTVLAFRRERQSMDYRPPWRHILLGRTSDGRYGQRFLALLGAIFKLPQARSELARAEIFYSRNIDQLILALVARWLFNRGARVVYEVLDIQPPFVTPGLASRALRALERFCLRRISLLVLSSPGFLDNYYLPLQSYRGPWFLLENKLPGSVSRLPIVARMGKQPLARDTARPWVIGYFGFIRGERTFDLMLKLAERMRGRVTFKFAGVLTTVERRRFDEATRTHDNIVYLGEYDNPRDLPRLYGDVDFAWALDLEHTEHNSRWLMPCRFYEAGYFAVPCLVGAGFQVGQIVDELKVGWSFREPYEEALVEFFTNLTPDAYAERRARLLAMPDNSFVGVDDAARLGAALEQIGSPAAQPLRAS